MNQSINIQTSEPSRLTQIVSTASPPRPAPAPWSSSTAAKIYRVCVMQAGSRLGRALAVAAFASGCAYGISDAVEVALGVV